MFTPSGDSDRRPGWRARSADDSAREQGKGRRRWSRISRLRCAAPARWQPRNHAADSSRPALPVGSPRRPDRPAGTPTHRERAPRRTGSAPRCEPPRWRTGWRNWFPSPASRPLSVHDVSPAGALVQRGVAHGRALGALLHRL